MSTKNKVSETYFDGILQLIAGKAVTLPRLYMGTVAIESVTDAEYIRTTKKTISWTTAEFRGARMCRKIRNE